MGGSKSTLSQSIHQTIQQLQESVLASAGETSPEERQRIAGWSANPKQASANQQWPEPLASVITKVTLSAYKMTDDDIQALRNAGYTEDAILELITSAAIGAAMRRYERGMAALRATKGADHAPLGS